MMSAMVGDAETPQQRLGRLVTARRESLGLSRPKAAELADVDRETWRALENGARTTRSYKRASIERVLRWRPRSIESVLNGDDPQPEPDAPNNGEPDRYFHPELGEITHEQDMQLWELTTFDEDTRVGFIFQARAKRMRQAPERWSAESA